MRKKYPELSLCHNHLGDNLTLLRLLFGFLLTVQEIEVLSEAKDRYERGDIFVDIGGLESFKLERDTSIDTPGDFIRESANRLYSVQCWILSR